MRVTDRAKMALGFVTTLFLDLNFLSIRVTLIKPASRKAPI